MSHIYQPVMLRTLLLRNGDVSRREIAAAFLAEDQSQLEYYDEIVKRYPTQALKRNGIIQHERGRYELQEKFAHMDASERAKLIGICDAKLADFVERRQKMIWKHRQQNFDPIPGTMRWRVLLRAMARCEACGINASERALQVDHIIPRSWGGSNDISNFQALCSLCNVQKLNGDATDFRKAAAALFDRTADCTLCHPDPANVVAENELALCLRPEKSMNYFHIAPKRHGAGYFSLIQPELNSIRSLELMLLERASELGIRNHEASMSVIVQPQSEHCCIVVTSNS